MEHVQTFLSICLGVGLSAACGFRVFVPLLCLSIASLSGNLELDSSFAWVGTMPALIAFAIATVVEIGAYYVPFIDNALDFIAVPLAAVAGVFVTALAMTDIDPFWRWSLAIIAGGGVATTTQLATTKLRAISSATTFGFGNPVLATIEAAASSILSFLAVVWPVAALVLALGLIAVSWWMIYYVGKGVVRLFRGAQPQTATASLR